jgi:pyruvate/2-oxoglutarate/acetoin dehydrogenase E1 component
MLKSAIRDDNPVLFFEHKLLYGSKGPRQETGAFDVSSEIPAEDYTVPLGVASILREGKDLTMVALMRMVYTALEAAEELSKQGIEAEVIDLRSLAPMDVDTVLNSLQKTNRMITVEESNLIGGWGSELSAQILEQGFDYLDAPVIRVGAPHTPVPATPVLENYYIPSAERIIRVALNIIS